MSAVIQNEYTGDNSTTTYSFTFPYLKTSDIKASLDGVATTAFTLPNATTLQFNTAPGSGAKIKIFRETSVDDLTATFYAGSAIKSEDLNDNFTQNLFKTQEVGDRALSTLGDTMTGNLTMNPQASLVFEGTTEDAHETTLTVVDPTADRTITFPNVTGNVVTTGDTGTVATAMIADDAITNAKLASNSVRGVTIVDGEVGTSELASSSVTTVKIADSNVTTAKLATDAVTAAKLADNAVVTTNIVDANVTTAKIAADAITNAKIANNSIDSEHYVDGSIDAAHLASNSVTNVKMADDSVGTAELQDSSVDTARLADNSVTLAKMTNNSVGTSELVNDAVTEPKIADNAVTMAKLANGTLPSDITIASANIPNNTIVTTDINDNAVTNAKIADSNLKTLAGMQSGTASIFASPLTLTSDISDLNQIDGLTKQTTITDSDASFPTSGAVVDYVYSQIAPIGGLEVIANEVSFPNSAVATGVVISISDAGGIVVNSSGTSTTARTLGGSTVTIEGFPSSLYSETLAAGIGLMVSKKHEPAHSYIYHKILGKEEDIKQLSDDINDFNARYRVGSSNPTSNNDSGDMFFNTSTGKMMVYDGTASAWEEVQSIGNFFISTLSPAFDNNTQNFTITNAPSNAEQILLSINGVIQKPNAGTSTPSEGFALDGNTVKLSAAPPTGSTYHAVVLGSTVNIGTPSNNTVSTAVLQNGSVTDAKVNASAAIAGTKISPDFGSQNITTTGNATIKNQLTINGTATGSTSTASEMSRITLKSNHSASVNGECKIKVWEATDGSNQMGFGISNDQLNYITTDPSYDHVFYGGSAGTSELLRVRASSDYIDIKDNIVLTFDSQAGQIDVDSSSNFRFKKISGNGYIHISNNNGHVYVDASNSGTIYLRSGNNNGGVNNAIVCNVNGEVAIYHAGSGPKLSTISQGIKITHGSGGSGNSTTLPTLSMDSSYHDSVGGNCKIKVYDDGSDGQMGFGISNNQLDYITHNDTWDHVFYGGTDGNVELLRIHGDRSKIEVVNQNLVFDNGYGIDFSATPNAGTTTSEVLDDYEEGTWTPYIYGTSGTPSWGTVSGSYTKIGNTVHARFSFQNYSGGITGTTLFTGWPYNTDFRQYHADFGYYKFSVPSSTIDAMIYFPPGGTAYPYWLKDGVTGSRWEGSAFSTGTYFEGTVHYRVA